MKIYNKKNFISGIFWTFLGISILLHAIIKPEAEILLQIKYVVLSVGVLIIGSSSLLRSLSKTAARQDLIEELDERNKLVVLKSKAKLLDLLIGILIAIAVIGFIGLVSSNYNIAWVFVFILPLLLLSFYCIANIVVTSYYENHE